LCLPVGTGGTIAGMINKLQGKDIIGFSALKGGEFLVDEIRPLLTSEANNWKIETQYHFGGYAKVKPDLNEFIIEFESTYHIPLDPVYTGKMMFGIFDMIRHNFFRPGSKILTLHTGGLQGRSGFNF
jgi:1-aminocyclopropane-1-carboxylate deaminase/D-cysteine desulfhydrase-like pyridoxal-dependent ACC family enzyme